MKKIKIFIILFLSMILVCSCQKNQMTEIILENGSIYKISKTNDKNEVRSIFQSLKQAQFERESFNGLEIKMKSEAYGKVRIENETQTNVEVKYDISLDGKANLKKYLFDGTLNLEGYTKTRSPSLVVDAKQKIIGNLKNDSSYLFLNGIYESNDNRINIKKKTDISSFTNQYQGLLMSICDIMKYKRLSEIIPELDSFILEYATAITQTKTSSFTVQFSFPVKQNNIDVFIELSSKTLLPISCSLHLDAILLEQLKEKYIEKYMTDLIEIDKASFKIKLDLTYGNYSITELNESEKEEYSEINKKSPNFLEIFL